MIDFKFRVAFFDTKEVRSKVSDATRRVFSKFGAFVRQTAKQSMKKKSGPAPPGQPPHSHVGLLKRWILFGYDKTRESVVVGPAKLPKKGNVPETLEKGGNVPARKNPRRVKRKIGDGGVLLLRKTNSAASKQVRDERNQNRWVTFGPLKSAKQVARAERLEAEIWGPFEITGTVEPRPYMGPALEEELPKLPPQWRDSVY